MKKLTEFLKTTAMGGLFVLLPVLLLYLLLSEGLQLIIALATPIAGLFPKETFDRVNCPLLIALILIVGVSFLIGLVMRSGTGKGIVDWIERAILGRLPAYDALKRLTTGFTGAGEGAAFRPAKLISPDGGYEPAYVVEEHEDGKVTVLLPWAPTAFAGSVKIVEQDRIEFLDVNLGDFSRCLSYWGVGLRDMVKREKQ